MRLRGIQSLLALAQVDLELEINRTPSGPERGKLTDANIHIMSSMSILDDLEKKVVQKRAVQEATKTERRTLIGESIEALEKSINDDAAEQIRSSSEDMHGGIKQNRDERLAQCREVSDWIAKGMR